MQRVLNFIARFTNNGKRTEVIECFTCGCCYWFAEILAKRFQEYEPMLMYAEIDNHWGCKILDRVYDITGDVTDSYDWIRWERMKWRDSLLYMRLFRDCINFGEEED